MNCWNREWLHLGDRVIANQTVLIVPVSILFASLGVQATKIYNELVQLIIDFKGSMNFLVIHCT